MSKNAKKVIIIIMVALMVIMTILPFAFFIFNK